MYSMGVILLLSFDKHLFAGFDSGTLYIVFGKPKFVLFGGAIRNQTKLEIFHIPSL